MQAYYFLGQCINFRPMITIAVQKLTVFNREGIKQKSPDINRDFDVVLSGLEPPTHGFSVRCSTN